MYSNINIKNKKKNKLPDDIKISTMSATCKLNVNVNLDNFFSYMKLSDDGILSMSYHGKPKSLESQKDKLNKKEIKKQFYNQITLLINAVKKYNINMKIFNNGSIQMTGCKDLDHCDIVVGKIIKLLKEKFYINRKKKFIKIELSEFKKENELGKFKKELKKCKNKIRCYDFKIVMINSNFKLGYKINRERLYKVLLSREKEDVSFEPQIHAAVNFKFEIDGEKATILIFQTGSIVITGAKNLSQIREAYKFINDIIKDNYTDVVNINVGEIIKSNKAFQTFRKLLGNDKITLDDLEEEDRSSLEVFEQKNFMISFAQ